MSTRARLGLAAAVALMSVVGIGIVVARWVGGDGRADSPIALRESEARAPFAGYRATRLSIGTRCVPVVIADTGALRASGLRGVNDLGPYAGMLFVQPSDTQVAFTMAGVDAPLDIVWFAADGSRVDATTMRPCPEAEEACPVYGAKRPYRYALETPAGAPAPVRLEPCS